MNLILDALLRTAHQLAAGIVVTCIVVLAFCVPLIIKANRKEKLERVKAFNYREALRPIGSAPMPHHYKGRFRGFERERIGGGEWRR